MFKIVKQEYTAEIKEEAVKRVTEVGSIGRAAEDLGWVEQTLRNWVKAGKLNPAGVNAITPEQMALSRLRAEVSRLRMECEILKNRRRTSREMHSEVRLDRNATHTVPTACDVLGAVSQPGGYRAWTHDGTPHRKWLTDVQLLALIQASHAELNGAYGSPRMRKELRERGFSAGKERVERLMRENSIYARHKCRYKATTDSKHAWSMAKNLLDRKFTRTAPIRCGRCPYEQ